MGRDTYAAAVSDFILVAVVALVMVVGVAGTVLPLVPGLWLVWAAAAVYGVVAGMGSVGWIAMAVISVLAIAGTGAGVMVPQRKATAIGTPLWGQLLSAALAAVGLFAIPIVGAILGFLVGVVVSAIATSGSLREAIPAARAIITSMVLTSGLQLAAATAMFLTWIGWVLLG